MSETNTQRRQFLAQAALTATGLIVAPTLLFWQDSKNAAPPPGKTANDTAAAKAPAKPPALDSAMVKEFVVAGHTDLAKVKEMHAATPNLIYATWDWAGGDFETALEGAGHMGNKEIARFLISQGARPNIYVLTMLGETAIVTGLLEKFPELLKSRGPHGLSLLHHASKGEAKELLAYFDQKGLTEPYFPMF